MYDFIDIANVLLNRVSINPFIFELPKHTLLFGNNNLSPSVLKNTQRNKYDANTPGNKYDANTPGNKYNVLGFRVLEKEQDTQSTCLVHLKESIQLFNYIKFSYFYSEKSNFKSSEEVVYLGIINNKLQVSTSLANLDYYVIRLSNTGGKENKKFLSNSSSYHKDAIIFNIDSLYKKYTFERKTKGDQTSFLFYFEYHIRNIFLEVDADTKYSSNAKECKYIIEGEQQYTPFSGYTSFPATFSTTSPTTSPKESSQVPVDYSIIENIDNIPIITINHQDFIETDAFLHYNKYISDNINRYCLYKQYRINSKFTLNKINECIDNNIFPYLKDTP